MQERLERVNQALKAYFGEDQRRIDHALQVAGFAELILDTEPADRELVMATALLHDIGIREAERKYGSSAGNLQEQEGPPVAKELLTSLGYGTAFIDEVCAIIACHHSPGEMETDNFRVIWDADWLVNIPDEVECDDRGRLEAIIEKVFLTATGKALAQSIYLK
jgi:hypothetical protein